MKKQAKIADFNQIKIGMVGEDYFSEFWKVEDYGTVREMCKKYDHNIDLIEFVQDGGNLNDGAVMCSSKGQDVVFVYGPEGIVVYL